MISECEHFFCSSYHEMSLRMPRSERKRACLMLDPINVPSDLKLERKIVEGSFGQVIISAT